MLERVWVVTGASKGLGYGFAKELATQGKTVIGIARESIDLGMAGANLAELSAESIVIACDLSKDSDIEKTANTILKRVKSIEGIIHNAGQIGPVKPMESVKKEDWNDLIKVNLLSVQDFTQRLLPLMKHSEQTRVTTISSGASQRSIEAWSAYCVSKAGLDMWTKCLAEEGKKFNISAISFAPGIVDTNMQRDIRSANPNDFPAHSNFVGYHQNGDLTDPINTAKNMIPLITQHTMDDSGNRFDIRDI